MNLFERILLWGSSLLVGVSGILYALMKYLMTTDSPYAVVNHPLQSLVLKIHIVSAPLLVFAIGVVFMRHIWDQWRSGLPRGRVSGLWTLLTLVPMAFSGYLIQSVTHDGWLLALIVVHVVTGGAYLVGFIAHQVAINLWLWRKRRKNVATERRYGESLEATESPAALRLRSLPDQPASSDR